jgi:hypothetical protein
MEKQQHPAKILQDAVWYSEINDINGNIMLS